MLLLGPGPVRLRGSGEGCPEVPGSTLTPGFSRPLCWHVPHGTSPAGAGPTLAAPS